MRTQIRHAPSSAEQVIETPRLLLISVTPESLHADEQRKGGLEDLLSVIVPATWPPEYWDKRAIHYLAQHIQRHPDQRGWCRYIALKQDAAAPPVLIGGCGCTEPPGTLEEVEIGYSILKEFRRHGYVSEALNALIPWIFEHTSVHAVCAQAYPHLAATIGVLRKCGFAHDGTGRDPGTVMFRRRRPVNP